MYDIPMMIKAPEFEKAASYRLSENIDGWDKEIIGHIHEDLPYVTKYNYDITFKKTDKKYGYAVGMIRFSQMKNVYIPLIINKYDLCAMDIMVVDGKPEPLTNDTFDAVTSTEVPMGELRDPRSTQPFLERQDSQASEVATYPIPKYGFLQLATGDASALKKIASANPAYLLGYKSNNTFDILKQAMKVKPALKTNAPNKVEGKQIVDSSTSPYDPIYQGGSYKISSLDNRFHDGVVINNVFDFDLEKQPYSIFISDKTYGYQEKYAGLKTSSHINIEQSDAKIGDSVVFVATKGDTAFSTIPVKIASKSSIDGVDKIAGMTNQGELINLYLVPGLKTITKCGEAYHIPSHKMKMVKLGNYKKFHWNTDSVAALAILKTASNITRIVRNGAMFSIENENIKNASYTPSEAKELLGEYYTNPLEMLKAASKKDCVYFTGTKSQVTMEKKAFSLGYSLEDLFKTASALADADSVDAVLSLNYINESNIAKYVAMINDFEENISKLAEILISIRLGMKGDETAVKNAMQYLQQTTNILKKFRE